jgi:hypothetical protein
MKLKLFIPLIAIFVLCPVCSGQSEATVKRTKEKYEKEHPGERTYFIEELVKVLDSADSIVPNARVMTFERSKDIGGAVFGSSASWDRSKKPNQRDHFTERYLKDNKLRQLILENLLADASAFERFMQEHNEQGFYRVVVWKAGYLMFYMIEGRPHRTGINYILIPAKPEMFNKVKAYDAKNP